MIEVKKKTSVAVLAVLLASVVWLCLAGGGVFAKADDATPDEPAPEAWSNYDVITDAESGAFVGVNIKDSTQGLLSTCIPQNAAPIAGVGFSMLTFALDGVSIADNTGILIQFDRSHATANTGARFFLETETGGLWRFHVGKQRDDTFIKSDGTVTYWRNETSSRYTLTSIKGTLYVPFSSLLKVTAADTGTQFVKFHYALDTRANGFFGENRPTAIGTIAAVNVGETVTVTRAFDATDLTYTVDAENADADVNLADMRKGNAVYSRTIVDGNNALIADAEKIAAVNGLPTYTRTDVAFTVRYVDGDGNEIAASATETGTFDGASGKYAYSVTAPRIAGYACVTPSSECSGTFDVDYGNELTLVYRAVDPPILTVKYVDEEGETIAEDVTWDCEYDVETETCSYDLGETPRLFGYDFVSASGALSGTFAEDTEITLTFRAKGFTDYDVAYDDMGAFAGVNLKNKMTGSLIVNITGFNSGYGYALTTVELGEVRPDDSTGILIRVKRTDGVGSAQVRMYLESSDGKLYRLFTRANDAAGGEKTATTLITPDGAVSEVTNEATNQRHQFTLNTDGTMYIPWSDIGLAGTTDGTIPAGTVFTKFHFGREARYETTCNKPIAIGMIAAVKEDDGNVVVEEIVDLGGLTYTNDADVADADVNLADMRKGQTVHFTQYLLGTHAVGADQTVLDGMYEIVEYTRMPPQITLEYRDEDGKTIKSATLANAEYAPSGSVYAIEPPTIIGYTFVSADRELQGVADSDFTVTLTYKKVIYHITLEFVDETGATVKESRTVSGTFGQYIEIEADEIDGYTFLEATSGLKFTVMGEKTIRMTYAKNADPGCGCGSSVGAVSGGLTVLLLLGAVCLLCVRRKTEKEGK